MKIYSKLQSSLFTGSTHGELTKMPHTRIGLWLNGTWFCRNITNVVYMFLGTDLRDCPSNFVSDSDVKWYGEALVW